MINQDTSFSSSPHDKVIEQNSEGQVNGKSVMEPEEQFRLGFHYAQEGKDYPQAARWYLKAANQGHALAQFNLGIMFNRGQGVARDESMSLYWLNKAACLGDAGAQHLFGLRLNRSSMNEAPGTGRESQIEAYKWLQLAVNQGYAQGQNGCDFVTMGMTREDVIEGKRRADAFVRTPAAD